VSERKCAQDRELRLDGEVREGYDEGERCTQGHPPDGDSEGGPVGLVARRGEPKILVGGEFGDQCREECDHPKLAEEDKSKDGQDENCCSKNSFHAFP
jgi:hypothetical protein